MATAMERPRGSMKLRALVCWKMLMAASDSCGCGNLPAAIVTTSLAHHSPSMSKAAAKGHTSKQQLLQRCHGNLHMLEIQTDKTFALLILSAACPGSCS